NFQKKHGIRKERIGEESTWMLSRFYPILEAVEAKRTYIGRRHNESAERSRSNWKATERTTAAWTNR
uniref:Uncharacterized protein n=1 Tax=Aegilops tauschii subsp. strangulata TaxID=200361 RepID=A0A453I3N9_AEGTS